MKLHANFSSTLVAAAAAAIAFAIFPTASVHGCFPPIYPTCTIEFDIDLSIQGVDSLNVTYHKEIHGHPLDYEVTVDNIVAGYNKVYFEVCTPITFGTCDAVWGEKDFSIQVNDDGHMVTVKRVNYIQPVANYINGFESNTCKMPQLGNDIYVFNNGGISATFRPSDHTAHCYYDYCHRMGHSGCNSKEYCDTICWAKKEDGESCEEDV